MSDILRELARARAKAARALWEMRVRYPDITAQQKEEIAGFLRDWPRPREIDSNSQDVFWMAVSMVMQMRKSRDASSE